MRKIHRELTKDEYKYLKSIEYNEQAKWLFPDGIPKQWLINFGYYGHELKKKSGHYFAVFSIGGSIYD